MLKKIIDWIKENPWLAGALAVGVVVLIWLMSRKSSAAATTTDATGSTGVGGTGLSEQGYITLQEAGLAASQNIQAVQLQAGVQTAGQQAQLQATLGDQATNLAIAQLQANVQLEQIHSSASSTDTATQAALTSSLAQTGAAVQEAQIAATEATTIAQDQTQVQLAQIGATNTANSVILQLVGLITGQPANPQPTTAATTTSVVPTVPTTQTTTGPVTPSVTSQPPAVVAPITTSAGALIPYDQITNNEWYQLIALETNQPLAQVQALYSQTVPGSTITNLQQTVGAHSTAQAAYDYYSGAGLALGPQVFINPQTGQVTASPALWSVEQQLGNVNPWSIPAGTPVRT